MVSGSRQLSLELSQNNSLEMLACAKSPLVSAMLFFCEAPLTSRLRTLVHSQISNFCKTTRGKQTPRERPRELLPNKFYEKSARNCPQTRFRLQFRNQVFSVNIQEEEMGLSSWFRDLGLPWKISVGILGGVAAVTSAYGLYTLYAHLKDRKGESFDGDTAGETSEKKILVLGLEGAGKSTFLAALAQHDSPITSEREATKPTEGFHVVCVSTEGISLNIWESEYHSFIFNI